eukprot:CAMPEP_0197726820 /NCGR_PEP_ID=MMETSP1434-20131217/17264_1 /TAXON_ID=265543 /ORGANISM="Minutocellus polymorphus, Strain CCMP3303" /LENGTH=121 /DNA_ID=CAMNT_0043312851 /DNA_START=60 /DNA_END=424 /DNA_ORIENTATION=+
MISSNASSVGRTRKRTVDQAPTSWAAGYQDQAGQSVGDSIRRDGPVPVLTFFVIGNGKNITTAGAFICDTQLLMREDNLLVDATPNEELSDRAHYMYYMYDITMRRRGRSGVLHTRGRMEQ